MIPKSSASFRYLSVIMTRSHSADRSAEWFLQALLLTDLALRREKVFWCKFVFYPGRLWGRVSSHSGGFSFDLSRPILTFWSQWGGSSSSVISSLSTQCWEFHLLSQWRRMARSSHSSENFTKYSCFPGTDTTTPLCLRFRKYSFLLHVFYPVVFSARLM